VPPNYVTATSGVEFVWVPDRTKCRHIRCVLRAIFISQQVFLLPWLLHVRWFPFSPWCILTRLFLTGNVYVGNKNM